MHRPAERHKNKESACPYLKGQAKMIGARKGRDLSRLHACFLFNTLTASQ